MLLWYFTANPDNILGIPTHSALFMALLLHVMLQIAVLIVQGVFGGRVFIPKLLQPAKYDYHKPVPEDVLANAPECVICMLPLNDPSPYAAEQPSERNIDSTSSARSLEDGTVHQKMSPEKYMITPCNHLFHTECLTQWMNEKMECPTCRGQLPQL